MITATKPGTLHGRREPGQPPVHLQTDWVEVRCGTFWRLGINASRSPASVTCPRCRKLMRDQSGYDLVKLDVLALERSGKL